MTAIAQPATIQDVEEIVEKTVGRLLGDFLENQLVPVIQRIIGDTVRQIVGDAMQAIAEHIDERFAEVDRRFEQIDERFRQIDERFEQIDRRFDAMDKRFDRLEDKLENTAATVDHHTIDIRQLRRRAA